MVNRYKMIEQKSIYKTASQTLSASRVYILISVLVYVLSALAGWIYSAELDFLRLQFEELVQKFEGLNAFEFIVRIFIHNSIAAYLAMCFVVLWGIVPLALAIFNGLILGWFAGWMNEASWAELLLVLAPHGIFEWSALFIAFGVGMWRGLGNFFTGQALSWAERWKRANAVFFIFVVPLLLVAAVIEGRYHLFKM
ncbi:MAG: stage II sporulation protein M [Desulfonatronovibrio sp.]